MEKLSISDFKSRYKDLYVLAGKPSLKSFEGDQSLIEKKALITYTVTHAPDIKFMLDLIEKDADFINRMPPEPDPDTPSAAEAYFKACLGLAQECAAQAIASEAFLDDVRETIAEYATHFSGKMTHSKAEGACAIAPAVASDMPHVSSRSLFKVGIQIPIDQAKLDQRKRYAAIAKIVNGDNVALMLPMRQKIMEAIDEGLELARKRSVDHVDRRLRQVLLPSGDTYIAVTPLAAAGLMTMIVGKAKEIEQSSIVDGSTKSVRFNQIDVQYGGGNPQNITIHTNKSLLQRPLLFMAPERSDDVATVVHFMRNPWRPRFSMDDIRDVGEHFTKMYKSFEDTSSLSVTHIYATGPLMKVTLDAHRQAMQISSLVALQDISMDEFLSARSAEPNDLDLCIFNADFGGKYRSALAEKIVQVLWQRLNAKGDGCALDVEVVRKNARQAIENILEDKCK